MAFGETNKAKEGPKQKKQNNEGQQRAVCSTERNKEVTT